MHINMINEVMSCRSSETENIKVGMAATEFVGSDRYPMVVTEVISDKKIRVARMLDEDYRTLNDNDTIQYLDHKTMMKYAEVTDTAIISSGCIYTYRKNKRWMPAGQGCWGTCAIHLGHADDYRDPSF